MTCWHCGKVIPDNARFCAGCGCAQQQTGVAPYVPPAQQPPMQYYQPQVVRQTVTTDSSSPGAFVLGLLLPLIISLIMFIAWQGKTPMKARSLLFGLLIRIAPTVLFIIWFIYYGIAYR